MTKATLLSCLVLALATGCVFSKKSATPKENSAISTEVEENFRKRWVDKRTAELVTKGATADAARSQADAEFRAQYDFSNPVPKK